MRTLIVFLLIAFAASAQQPNPAAQTPAAAVRRSADDRLRDFGMDVKDYGAKCDGTTDDTAAIQAALDDASGNGRLMISGPRPCVISRTVYVPATAEGILLQSTRVADGVGLIAKSGSPAFQMLRIYAAQAHVRDLFLNCNSVASSGLVVADARQSVFDNILAIHCTSDAFQVNPFATPASTITSAIPAGAAIGTKFTVASAALPGLTLGGPSCFVVDLDHGKPNEDAIQISASGNTLTLSGSVKPRYAHTSGATVQCYGSNNAVILNNLEGTYSAGWGLNIFSGSDNNAITIRDPTMFANKAGGELLSGSGGRHIGGHLEGNNGPAIQLGDLGGGGSNGTDGRATYGWIIDPVNDLENSSPAYNAVSSICDFRSVVSFHQPSELLFNVGGPFCKTDPAGNSTIGTGLSVDGNGDPRFSVKTASGMVTTQPGAGLDYYDPSGKLKGTFGPDNADISGKLTFGSNMEITGSQIDLRKTSGAADIELNRDGKPNAPVTLYNGTGTPEVTLNPTGNSSFPGIQARGLAGGGNRPACIDPSGNIYAGTNANGVLTCP